MHGGRSIATTIAAFTLGLGPVFAQCVPAPSALSDFGVVPLGASWMDIPDDIPPGEYCYIDRDYPYSDCSFYDNDGIRHSAFGGIISAKTIYLSEFRGDVLPFDLSREDRLADVVRKLDRRNDAPYLQITVAPNSRTTSVFSYSCLLNEIGQEFRIEMEFDMNYRMESFAVIIPPQI